ncbi:MAG: glycosyltransferase family 4 protein, partial [Bacteroidota bacterium]
KGKGKKIILVRGSAHIQKQEALLKEEYKKINVDFEIDNRIIQKELLEYKMADFIDVPSKFAYNSFIEYGINTQKLTINTLAIDKEFNSKKNALLHKTTYEKIRILYLGHLSIRKGIIYLLKAIEAISKQNTNIELWLVGGITKELHDIVEKYKQYPFIKFFGHIPKEELNTVLTQCTIGVLPSIEDGFGQVIPEMLSYGIPVIVTENCGGSDLIDDGQNGFLIPAQSSEALVEKITYLFNREELKRMSICASKTVGRSFNWDHYGDKYVAFLKSL